MSVQRAWQLSQDGVRLPNHMQLWQQLHRRIRALSARISEHQGALWNPGKKSYVDTPLARHRVAAHHDDTPDIRVTILGVETDTVRRKILEAIWIKRVRPQINIKKEMEDALKFIH